MVNLRDDRSLNFNKVNLDGQGLYTIKFILCEKFLYSTVVTRRYKYFCLKFNDKLTHVKIGFFVKYFYCI